MLNHKSPLPIYPVIIGSGLAGMATALQLAARGIGSRLITRSALGEQTSSAWAQGGIAAAMGADDTPALHAADTLQAGAGHCDPATVKMICDAAPAAIRQLEQWGVGFDRDAHGYKLGLEGAHSRRRILHITGDGSGAAIIAALAQRVLATPLINVIQGTAVQLLADDNGVTGCLIATTQPATRSTLSGPVILATGGAGALWQETTNPLSSYGHGLLLALQAGAQLRDLEFMQFHPTALDIGRDPMPLLSEALRGEGAVLMDQQGRRFMTNDLAPRDVVSRAIAVQVSQGNQVFLDCRPIKNFTTHFPAITKICHSAGLDPAADPLPVKPAAHYHMGGVATDADGRSSVPGLYAVGEVACTGLHGANRLASNSLLEAAVMAERVAAAVREAGSWKLEASQVNHPTSNFRLPASIRTIMSTHVGVVRSEAGLQQAVAELQAMVPHLPLAQLALQIAQSALARRESVGAHYLATQSQSHYAA